MAQNYKKIKYKSSTCIEVEESNSIFLDDIVSIIVEEVVKEMLDNSEDDNNKL